MPQTAQITLTLLILGALSITTTALPNATEGQAYNFQLQATGGSGNYVWSLVSGTMPAGLTLSAAGLISGTPTVSGTFNLTIQVQG